MGEIIIATSVLGGTALIIGILLGIAGEKLQVEVDEKELQVRELLPGNNCGGCGYPGCDGLASAIAEGKAEVNSCPVGGLNVANKISEVMGVTLEEKEKQVAFVRCGGTCDKTKKKYNYYGIEDCRKAVIAPGGGDKACSYGCLGYGSCVKECLFDAIHIVDGIAVVDKEKCVACGKCVNTCPNSLIELIPYSADYRVQCMSNDKGKDVKTVCDAGCIGCTLCTRVCESKAITVENNLAKIDYSKCTNCGKCAEKCPVKIIRQTDIITINEDLKICV
ncbi:RnfABCDGE type electron transport complex subunit B [uncultured Clostridium sp.]|uniref:RnfABCDGE type electron transport complex subunit B n=1 Tax=uncultured Clostridium sp. TaxID=59620 RepID=UPI00258CB1C9|nr:RnfABCDGE type electron transport complex subunit B [uncultured Clostridium sp.]